VTPSSHVRVTDASEGHAAFIFSVEYVALGTESVVILTGCKEDDH
jgi:hypothetical protein